MRCCWGFIAGVCQCQSWPTLIPVGAAAKQRQSSANTSDPQHRSAALLGLSECKAGRRCFPRLPSYSSLASSLHARSNHQSALSLGEVQGCGGASASLCGSACRPAADPQIIITIKHCFPNKTISLPLILCQSLFLFTSGHSNPGTALTRGKTQAQLKISPCSVDEMEMYELTAGHHRIRILPHTCSVCADYVCFRGYFFCSCYCFSLWGSSLRLLM